MSVVYSATDGGYRGASGHVLARAPYRQWVFRVPKALRLRLARDPAWTTWVGNLAVCAIGAWQRRVVRQPRRHLVRYAGVFGPASKRRAQLRALVPAPAGEPPPSAATPRGSAREGRVAWAELLRRVFATDVLSCPCGGRRSVIAVVVDAARARAVLTSLGLPCTPATFAPARDPPQAEFWFDDAS